MSELKKIIAEVCGREIMSKRHDKQTGLFNFIDKALFALSATISDVYIA